MKKLVALLLLVCLYHNAYCWGFFAHRRINYYAVFLLPPEMMVLYKPYSEFLSDHAVDPDKRRYVLKEEAPRHYIDMDHYGAYPYDSLPRKWTDAIAKYSRDTLYKHGIVPWWLQTMLYRLTLAFKEKDQTKILKYSAEIGHYIADAHVPLHTSENHNGQLTDQVGIHGFWESRIPELLADKEWDFLIGKAEYINKPAQFIWERIMESAAAADTVLRIEKELSLQFKPDRKYAFENRNGLLIRQYSSAYSKAYNAKLNGMVERRMRQSIYAIACFWYTAWVNAGQPDLSLVNHTEWTKEELAEFEKLNQAWNGQLIDPEH